MDSPSPQRKTNWIQLASFVLIALLTVETILLIIQNRDLKATLKALTGNPIEPLKPGEIIEPVRVQTLDGQMTDLAFAQDAGKRQLLFIFSTTCPYCEKTLPVWSHMAGDAAGNGNVSVMGVSTTPLVETKKYIEERKPGFFIVTAAVDTSFSRKYKISGVPETILVRGNGTVIKVWIGELQPDQVEEIQTLLSASRALK